MMCLENKIIVFFVFVVFLFFSLFCCALGQSEPYKIVNIDSTYRMAQFESILYVYGKGVIKRSGDGGSSWNEVLAIDSGSRNLMRCHIWQSAIDGRRFLTFSISHAYDRTHYFLSVDGVDWIKGSEYYVPSVNVNVINGISYRDENGRAFTGMQEFLSLKDYGVEIGALTLGVVGSEDSVFIAVYRKDTQALSWSRVSEIPEIRAEYVFNIIDEQPYGLIKLEYFRKWGVCIAFLERVGMFYSHDQGITWKRVWQVSDHAKIVGFAEWQDFLVIVHADCRVERIPKNEAFGVE